MPAALRPLHLAAEIGGPPPGGARHDLAGYAELARLAERGHLDFITLGEVQGRQGPDALTVLSGVVPATRRIGLVPAVRTVRAAQAVDAGCSFRVPAAVATLDRVSGGRAGWLPGGPPAGCSTGDGTPHPEGPGSAHTAPDHSGGRRPVTVIDATRERDGEAAARYADVALVGVRGPEEAAASRERLCARAAVHGRAPGALRVLAALTVRLSGGERSGPGGGAGGRAQVEAPGTREAAAPFYRGGPVDLAELITAWHRTGAVDGFHLTPAEPLRDLERLVNGTVALLQHRSRFRTFYPGGTLREHLCLARPAGRYTRAV
jgi:alkanesulfonate monooxygenase SsuD/methylene tetrahydromethanopterin reductase-like flavin-dependent oxidoreductase (luciferase family)